MEAIKNNLHRSRNVIVCTVLFLFCIIIFQKFSVPNYLVIKAQEVKSFKHITSERPITMLAVGDIMLGRHVEDLMEQHGDNYPFTYVDSILESPDLVLANLEGPIVVNHTQTPSFSTHFEFDTRMPAVLARHHISLVTLANNHSYDLGKNGYDQTVAFLDNAAIAHVGNPYDFSDKYVLRKNINNQKLIFVAFNITNPNFNYFQAKNFVATISRESGDFLIAVIHGGDEYHLHSNTTQETFYRALIDKGVDLVIAHHPHVVEEVEVYNNKAIFYSLGNFIFDQYFSIDVQEELAVKINLKSDSVTYDLIPLSSYASQPELMKEDAKRTWLNTLASRSSKNIQEAIKEGNFTLKR
jgi:poly-gamma-glutamate synthesis protein (capsule biosynthesis protein)